MARTLVEKVTLFLKRNLGCKFTAQAVARALIGMYPAEYEEKARKSKLDGDALARQLAAEIGSRKENLAFRGVTWDDRPRPRRYYFVGDAAEPPGAGRPCGHAASADDSTQETPHRLEKDLYMPLMRFLSAEIGLSCMRISESVSKNDRGAGGNKWLHPDIVAVQRLDRDWQKEVRDCLGDSSAARIRIWSFEVKKDLTTGNFRESFFQAVSNSTWANEGYLVATSLSVNMEDDLRLLSALHGIGVIILDMDRLDESEIFLPARQRLEVDWRSVNRIAAQNRDFREFLERIHAYLKSGYFDDRAWNR